MGIDGDIYFYVDLDNKKILEEPKPLQTNWKNISGLSFLTDDELSDLSWAGHDGFGFIKFDSINQEIIKDYSFDGPILLKFKSQLKDKLNRDRIRHEKKGVIVNNQYLIKLDVPTKISLSMKYLQCNSNKNLFFNWETSSGYKEFTSLEFINLFEKIMQFIQTSIDIKIEYSKKIESCNTISELISVKFSSIKWNSNEIKL